MTNPPESWPNQTKGVLLVASCLGTPVYSTSHQIYPSKCTSWMAEIRQNISLDKMMSSQDRKEDGKYNLIWFLLMGTTAKFV